MHCPRLDHFVRLNPNGTVSRCGHMINPPQFDNLELLESSAWLSEIKQKFCQDSWPSECQRCEETEKENNTSIRLNSIKFDQQQTQKDYLTVGGVLDNICNSACLTCNENLSTKIGSLRSKQYQIVNNTNHFWKLPPHRIVHLDLNGGEPSYSKNYKQILANLPPNVKSVRLNTNCSTVLNELVPLTERGISVTVTVSLDGIGAVHDLIRWPITWDKFYKNLLIYRDIMPVELNLWTTVSVLNVDDLPNIIAFAQEHGIDHSYAYLKRPDPLALENKNTEKSRAYIQEQLDLRGIK